MILFWTSSSSQLNCCFFLGGYTVYLIFRHTQRYHIPEHVGMQRVIDRSITVYGLYISGVMQGPTSGDQQKGYLKPHDHKIIPMIRKFSMVQPNSAFQFAFSETGYFLRCGVGGPGQFPHSEQQFEQLCRIAKERGRFRSPLIGSPLAATWRRRGESTSMTWWSRPNINGTHKPAMVPWCIGEHLDGALSKLLNVFFTGVSENWTSSVIFQKKMTIKQYKT